VAVPITFSILTNIAAFTPLAFVPGFMGKIFRVIPLVVASVFVISWVEALLILPTHVAHARKAGRNRVGRWLHHQQQRFSGFVSRLIQKRYGPVIDACLRYRYLSLATGVTVLILILGYVASGRIGVVLMPRTESDEAVVTATLPYGSPVSRAIEVRDQLLAAAEAVAAEHGRSQLVEGAMGVIDENTVEVVMYLTKPEVRPVGTMAFTRLWRERSGEIKGLESLRFEADRGGPGRGADITVELAHRNIDVLDRASENLAASLSRFASVTDINDGYTPGKQQLDFKMQPEGRSLGLTAAQVARQVRSAFYGAEALRQQRGRNEVKVMVRRPKPERISEYDVEELIIQTPTGLDVPLRHVATVERGRAYTSITRRDGRRTVSVTGDVDPPSETNQVLATLRETALPRLTREYPGLSYSFQGHQEEMRESLRPCDEITVPSHLFRLGRMV